MKKIFISLMIFANFSFGENLNQLIEKAINNNPQLKAYNQQVESSKFNLEAEKQLYYPSFFTNISEIFYSKTPRMEIAPFLSFKQSNKNFTTFNIGLKYDIYTAGLRSSSINISKYQLTSDRYLYNDTLKSLKAEVKKAYFDLMIAKALVDIYQKELENVDAHLKETEGFLEQGLVTKVELLQAKVRKAEVERDLRDAKGRYKVALSNLERLVGESLKNENFEPVNIPIKDIEDIEELKKETIQNSDKLKALKFTLRQLQEKEKIEQSQFLPKIYTQAGYQYTNQVDYLNPKGNFILSISAGVEFQGIKPYYKILQAKSDTKKIEYQIQDLENNLKLLIEKAYEELKTAKDNLKVAEENLSYAKEYYELVKEQYRNQIATGTDLINAESALTRALSSREISYYQYLKTLADIEYLTGKER
ncbi:TolC family protein [Venenivibrio stagnispumantis]|uniref:Outer membrane protein TolC n=1 Tax=Venenivibrio stagnispumantis TaxID=407998 RepID=A0AA45WJR5_9AQUI|nr:TolC family protein [Venenivibrio stagnispumantis]MCW4572917.1 TolC family protein [Venenivibrio stagnispumantis]SMP04530.1 Outer membrane protein TolC [Venenivibrio stagnispumantis]